MHKVNNYLHFNKKCLKKSKYIPQKTWNLKCSLKACSLLTLLQQGDWFFLKNNKKVFRYQFKIKKNTNMLIWTFQKLPLWNLLKISTTLNITTTLDHCIAKSNPKEKKLKFWLMNLNLLSYRSRWSDLFITIEVENWSPMILAIERNRSLDSHDPCYPR